MTSQSPLSYRVLAVPQPEHRIGRWIVKWLSIACIIQAVSGLFGIAGMVQSDGYYPNYLGNQSWQNIVNSVLQLAICPSAFLVIISCFGTFMRGHFFRRFA